VCEVFFRKLVFVFGRRFGSSRWYFWFGCRFFRRWSRCCCRRFLSRGYRGFGLLFRRQISWTSVSIEKTPISNFEIRLVLLHGFIKPQSPKPAKTRKRHFFVAAFVVLWRAL